jgi:O-glycosyl hydrolase
MTTRTRTLAVLATTLALGAALTTACTPGHRPGDGASPPPVVTVDAAPAQTIDHFGASGAWWPNDLAAFPRATQERVADLLFGDDGIALSGYRYNIGGGGVGVSPGPRAPATFLVAPGTYDWTRDPGGTTFALLAARHGVTTIVGFVNSAPPEWTTSGKSCGGQLTPGTEGAYAQYLADVVAHLRASGIPISHVSPMNEPDDTFAACGQEGMAVPVGQRATVVRSVANALAAQYLPVGVTADESASAYFQFRTEVPQWLDEATLPDVAALAHHTSEFPTDDWLAQVAPLGAQFGKPTWMTEICCYDGKGPIVGFGPQYDPTMTSGLWLAHSVWQDLAITGDSAFDWWTALSSAYGCDPTAGPSCTAALNTSGWNDGLLYYDPAFRTNGDHAITTTKRFFVLGNFSRSVRPGSVRHVVDGVPSGLEMLAFRDGGRWVVVVTNQSTTASSRVDVALPQTRGHYLARHATRTSASLDLATVAGARPHGRDTFTIDVPPASVTTDVFDVVPGP